MSAEEAAIAGFLAKLADFSYDRLEAAEQLDPGIPVENGWLARHVRSIGDPASGLDYSLFSRIDDAGGLDIAIAFRGAQVTWRPQLLDVHAGLLRGLPQWQASRQAVLKKLHVPLRSCLRSGGQLFITGQSMGHMLVQFAAADLIDDLAHDAQLQKLGDWPASRIASRFHVYGFGGVGVADLLGRVAPAPNRVLDAALLDGADVKHILDSWDPAQLLRWRYAGGEGRSWTAPKPWPPVRTALTRAFWRTSRWGWRYPNILFPLAFLWHLFYTAHSVTGYNASDFTRSRQRRSRR